MYICTLYKAELISMQLMIHMANSVKNLWKLTIYMNNQEAIKVLEGCTHGTQSYLTDHLDKSGEPHPHNNSGQCIGVDAASTWLSCLLIPACCLTAIHCFMQRYLIFFPLQLLFVFHICNVYIIYLPSMWLTPPLVIDHLSKWMSVYVPYLMAIITQ